MNFSKGAGGSPAGLAAVSSPQGPGMRGAAPGPSG